MINLKKIILSILITSAGNSIAFGMKYSTATSFSLKISNLNLNEYFELKDEVQRLYELKQVDAMITDEKIAKMFLAHKWNPWTVDLNGYSVFEKAVLFGHTNVVRVLLAAIPVERRFDMISGRFTAGCTALHVAAKKGFVEILRLLLAVVPEDQMVNFITVECDLGFTALHEAAFNESNCVELSKILLEYYHKFGIAVPHRLWLVLQTVMLA